MSNTFTNTSAIPRAASGIKTSGVRSTGTASRLRSTASTGKKQVAGHSVSTHVYLRSDLRPQSQPQAPSTAASSTALVKSSILKSENRVTVTSQQSRVKKANIALPKKKVRFGGVNVREFRSQPGDSYPGSAELFEGEVDWKEWRERLAKNNGEDLWYCQAHARAIIKQLDDEEKERREARELAEALEDRRLELHQMVVEAIMEQWEIEFNEQSEAAEAAGDESGWNLMLYGQQDLLTEEPSPVSGPWDEAFDADILELMERQDAYLAKKRRRAEYAAAGVAMYLDVVLTQWAAEVQEEDDTLKTSDSGWQLFEYGGNNSLLVDEDMPFSLPIAHPDTTFELADLSFFPDDDMEMLTETREPRCRDVLEHIPEWFVPGVTADDIALRQSELNGLVAQGIRPSATDDDIWIRMRHGETPFLSTKEEYFFEVPVEMPFVQQLEAEFGDESMLTGDLTTLKFPDTVNPVLETASADNTVIAYDPNDHTLWSYEKLRAAVAKLTIPELRALVVDENEVKVDSEFF